MTASWLASGRSCTPGVDLRQASRGLSSVPRLTYGPTSYRTRRLRRLGVLGPRRWSPCGRACPPQRRKHRSGAHQGGLRGSWPGRGASARAAHARGHRDRRRGGGYGDAHTRRGPGGPVGPGRRLARGGRTRGAAREREGARVRLGGRQRDRDLPGPRQDPGHRVGSRHRGPHASEREHRLQRLLQRAGPFDGRLTVPCRREQERPARGHRADAHIRLRHGQLEPWGEHGGRALVPERHAPPQRGDADHRRRARDAGGA